MISELGQSFLRRDRCNSGVHPTFPLHRVSAFDTILCNL
jgi:hypothetical protein